MRKQLSKWMSYIDDETPLSDLIIPGSHNCGTCNDTKEWNLFGRLFNFTGRCQDRHFDIYIQLLVGIRYLDIRVRLNKHNELINCHGICTTGLTIRDIFRQVKQYITYYPTETILLYIQHEYVFKPKYTDETLVNKLNEAIISTKLNENLIFCSEIPKLGNCRGKVILYSPCKFKWDIPTMPSNGQWESYKCKCTKKDLEYKKKILLKSAKESYNSKVMYVNQVNSIGSLPILRFIPYPYRFYSKIKDYLYNIFMFMDMKGVVQLDFAVQNNLLYYLINRNFEKYAKNTSTE